MATQPTIQESRRETVALYSGEWGRNLYGASIDYEYDRRDDGEFSEHHSKEILSVWLEDGESLTVTVYPHGTSPLNGVYALLRGLIDAKRDDLDIDLDTA